MAQSELNAGAVGEDVSGFADATAHLLAEMARLEAMLRLRIHELRAASLLTEDAFRGLYIPDSQVDNLLARSKDSDGQPRASSTAAAESLAAEIERLRGENEARAEASRLAGISLPLVRLAHLFNLSPFDLDVILICMAPELDLKYETLYSYVQNDVTRKRPSVDLALKLLAPTVEMNLARRVAFAPGSPLLRNHLVRLFEDPQEREPPLPARFLKLDERISDFLLEIDGIDSRLLPFTRSLLAARGFDELALPDDLKARLRRSETFLKSEGGVILFNGAYGVGKRSAACALCRELQLPLISSDLEQAMAADLPFSLFVQTLLREAVLRGAALYLNHFEHLLSDEPQTSRQRVLLMRELASHRLPVFLGSEAPWRAAAPAHPVSFLSFDLPQPEFPSRLRLWAEALNDCGKSLSAEADLHALANKFTLSAGQIRDAAREATQLAMLRPAEQQKPHELSLEDLHAAARDQSRHGLNRLAQKVETFYAWNDLVLPARPLQQLREVCASVKYRHVVYSDWGFDRKLSLGKGLNVLFSGQSGTGKTMAASILARELGLDLYKIDLSSVVSKYIGETEKNLSGIFCEAQASNAILFFDEADALFGKRSEVKDAHDRYANIEVAYLLQQMEAYEGIVILATNLSKNLDEAFARRMHHTLEFPFPDALHRERIWRGMIPENAPLADDVDFVFLAGQFEFAGGNIRNIVLAAAFMAAAGGEPICMRHMILATAREWQKLGKLPAKTDLGRYYEMIRERG